MVVLKSLLFWHTRFSLADDSSTFFSRCLPSAGSGGTPRGGRQGAHRNRERKKLQIKLIIAQIMFAEMFLERIECIQGYQAFLWVRLQKRKLAYSLDILHAALKSIRSNMAILSTIFTVGKRKMIFNHWLDCSRLERREKKRNLISQTFWCV